MLPRPHRLAILIGTFALALAAPAAAGAQEPPSGATGASGALPDSGAAGAPKALQPARVTLKLKRVHGRRVHVGKTARLSGTVNNFVQGQRVKAYFGSNGHPFHSHTLKVKQVGHRNIGRFHLVSRKLIAPESYGAHATLLETQTTAGDRANTKRFGVKYPDLHPGDHGADVDLFEHLMARRGYFTPHSGSYNSSLGLTVLAFRKVNHMARTTNATPGIFKKLAAGKGSFNVRYPGAGRHVEVNISEQAMALIDHGKPKYTFHVSTGAPATPTITGRYSVYSKTPGYNSEGMYYSSYWHGGYAVHGYASVPPYNASHGCVRVPIPDAVFIYNWINYGTEVDTYY